MIISKNHFTNIRYFNLILLTIVSFIMPFYICETNRHNLIFSMPEIPLVILVFYEALSSDRKRDKLYKLLLLAYFIVFMNYNIFYLQCYWALFFKVLSFLLMSFVDAWDRECKKEQNFIWEFTDSIIFIFTIAVILSIFARVVGIDAIYCDLHSFHMRARDSGIFLDERLTWVFMHKSSYGLLLVAALSLLMKRKRYPYRKYIIILYIIATLMINSMVTLVSIIIILFVNFLEAKQFSQKAILRFFFLMCIGVISGIVTYYIVILNRNLSNLGDRAYIWAIYASSLKKYPHGMGKTFFTKTFFMPISGGTGRNINNFHNVLLNEMIHYSIPVGLLYGILITYFPIKYIIISDNKIKNSMILVALILPMIFDQAMNDLILPIYLIMLKLSFSKINSKTYKPVNTKYC